jgi:U2 small nuclear ribonucleoprotein B''
VKVNDLLSVMKASLRGLFKSYGEVLDVVAHSNLRMRGQAFVSFESADIAKKALKEVRGFPLYSKPMVMIMVIVCLAKT